MDREEGTVPASAVAAVAGGRSSDGSGVFAVSRSRKMLSTHTQLTPLFCYTCFVSLNA